MSLYRDLAMPMFRLRFYDDDHDLDLMDAMRRAMMMQDYPMLMEDSAGSEKKDNKPSETPKETGLMNTNMKMSMKDFAPLMSTDLVETEKEYNIHVDLPGVCAEDMEVLVQDKWVIIQAERKAVHEEDKDKVHTMERKYGKVERRIRLPANADSDAASTSFKNGVLLITFPKKDMKVRKLNVV
eukprot:gene24358-29443_t